MPPLCLSFLHAVFSSIHTLSHTYPLSLSSRLIYLYLTTSVRASGAHNGCIAGCTSRRLSEVLQLTTTRILLCLRLFKVRYHYFLFHHILLYFSNVLLIQQLILIALRAREQLRKFLFATSMRYFHLICWVFVSSGFGSVVLLKMKALGLYLYLGEIENLKLFARIVISECLLHNLMLGIGLLGLVTLFLSLLVWL